MYLNKYDFGYQADGVQSAAKIFFDKTPQTLSIEESATLVGMLKNSSLYNPIRRSERVREAMYNVQAAKAIFIGGIQRRTKKSVYGKRSEANRVYLIAGNVCQ